MALNKRLNIYPDETGCGNWIKFVDFISFMRKNLTPCDSISAKGFRADNMKRDLRKNKENVKIIRSEEYVCVFAITKYIFNHCDKMKVCEQIAREIVQNELSSSKVHIPPLPFSERCTMDLYKQICKACLKGSFMAEILCQKSIDFSLTTVLDIHKSSFTKQEWV